MKDITFSRLNPSKGEKNNVNPNGFDGNRIDDNDITTDSSCDSCLIINTKNIHQAKSPPKLSIFERVFQYVTKEEYLSMVRYSSVWKEGCINFFAIHM